MRELQRTSQKYNLPWPFPKDAEVVKKAYQAAMMKHHPDKGGTVEDAQAINRWHEIATAFLEGRLRPAPRSPMPGMWGPTVPFTGTTNAANNNATTSAADVGWSWGGFVVRIRVG